jgi:formate-dependent nitrite reductase membrane component NrfD
MHAVGGASGTILRNVAPALALLFLGITGVLLVADLKRPERFWTILVRPQWRSWLAKGAVVITLYGLILAAWALASWTDAERWLDLLAWPMVALAMLTAVYTAFLFAQCEGRDLWQSRLLALHLLVHAPVSALATFLLIAPLFGGDAWAISWAEASAALLTVAALLALMDVFGRHPTTNAEAAAIALRRGADAPLFWTAIAAGALLPATLFVVGPVAAYPLAGTLALGGLWLYGHALVRAGQRPAVS